MLFGERSIALLPKKHCFSWNGALAYTLFNFRATGKVPVLKKFGTLSDFYYFRQSRYFSMVFFSPM